MIKSKMMLDSDKERLGQRVYDAEFLRCLACFSVVLAHCTGLTFSSSILLNSMARFCVPVFIILSGRFCLMRERSIKHYLKKCFHLLIVFLFWSSIYELFDIVARNKPFSKQEAFRSMLTGPLHFWYIYTAIALYLAAPILYAFCRQATKAQLIYYLCLSFFFGSIVTTALRTSYVPMLQVIIEKMKIGYTVGFLFLFIFGYYKEAIGIEKRHRILLYIAGGIGLAITWLGTCYLQQRGSSNDEQFLSLFTPNVILYSLAVYVFITECKKLKPISTTCLKAISEISSCSFGIYLLHPLILQQAISKITALSLLPNVILIFSRAGLAFLLSFFFTFVLKKSFFRKLL